VRTGSPGRGLRSSCCAGPRLLRWPRLMRRIAVPGLLLLWRQLAVSLPLGRMLAVSCGICSLLLLICSPMGGVGRIVLLLIVSRPGRCMLVSLRIKIALKPPKIMAEDRKVARAGPGGGGGGGRA